MGVLVILIGLLALYNQIALRLEKERIEASGQLVDLGGYRVHVYTEGEREDTPPLVFLSGSATVAPAYDFKALYRLLSDEYRIAVVEKAGYGYSDILDLDRDIDSLVNELRRALAGADIKGPYLLLPHSLSGLEALYWAQEFPEEVAGIIGLDMAVPSAYDDFDFAKVEQRMKLGALSVKLGLLRIPGLYPLHESPLSDTEKKQQELLMYRNALNLDYIAEAKAIYDNAQRVKAGGAVSCPILMFASDGRETGDAWIQAQKSFAEEHDALITILDCGHYLHHYKSGEIAAEIKLFLEKESR